MTIRKVKESKERRLERLALSGALRTQVKKDKKKYTRKKKHKNQEDE